MTMPFGAAFLRILLVEDSKGDAFLIEKALYRAMPEARGIENAQTLGAALRILTESEFDVALLDRSLPDCVGYGGLRSIQNMAPKLPVIFLTAYKDETTALESIEQGAQDYLLKDRIDGDTIKRAIRFAIIRKQFENELVVQANYDSLTGLANRMLFENRLDMALAKMERHGGRVAVLFLDLNRFKQVNDTYGHAVGDRLLAEIGARLRQCLRPYDTAARFGGDEFAMLIEGIPDAEQCAIVAQKIIKSAETPFVTSGVELNVGASIGITTCAAGQHVTRAELMLQADAAMYEAKSVPESGYRFFSGDLHPAAEHDPRMTA